MNIQDLAEKYLSSALTQVCESKLAKLLMKLAYVVAIALVFQVLILTYVAYRVSSLRAF
jgi:hypothetical protein